MCAEYLCAWVRGFGAIGDQPDKCGVLVDRRTSQFGHVLTAKSLKPGATRSERGRRAVKRVAREARMLCLIVDDDDSLKVVDAVGSSEAVNQFKQKAQGQPVALGGMQAYAENLIRHFKAMEADCGG